MDFLGLKGLLPPTLGATQGWTICTLVEYPIFTFSQKSHVLLLKLIIFSFVPACQYEREPNWSFTAEFYCLILERILWLWSKQVDFMHIFLKLSSLVHPNWRFTETCRNPIIKVANLLEVGMYTFPWNRTTTIMFSSIRC